MDINNKIEVQLAELSNKDWVRRQRARDTLVRIGKPAVGSLIELLTDKNQHLRWEACKALGSIRDPAAAVQLVNALQDDSVEIQWLAAEALIALGTKSLVPLLRALEEQFDSIMLCQGAHHVLHALEREQLLNRKTLAVLDSMRSLSPELPIAVAAHEALTSLLSSKR